MQPAHSAFMLTLAPAQLRACRLAKRWVAAHLQPIWSDTAPSDADSSPLALREAFKRAIYAAPLDKMTPGERAELCKECCAALTAAAEKPPEPAAPIGWLTESFLENVCVWLFERHRPATELQGFLLFLRFVTRCRAAFPYGVVLRCTGVDPANERVLHGRVIDEDEFGTLDSGKSDDALSSPLTILTPYDIDGVESAGYTITAFQTLENAAAVSAVFLERYMRGERIHPLALFRPSVDPLCFVFALRDDFLLPLYDRELEIDLEPGERTLEPRPEL